MAVTSYGQRGYSRARAFKKLSAYWDLFALGFSKIFTSFYLKLGFVRLKICKNYCSTKSA
jgi:hypothetical protein